MTEPTDRLKIREIGTTEWVKKWTNVNGEWIDAGILQDAKIGEGNSGFEFYKDEKLEYQHTLMKSHLGFARFYHEHQFTHAYLSAEEIYDLWQEKSREK